MPAPSFGSRTSIAWRARIDVRFALGLAAIVLLAAGLRAPHLAGHLPALIHPDEPTVVERGLAALDGRLTPPQFDWPPASAYVYAAVVAGVRLAVPDVTVDPGTRYLLGRIVFLLVALVAVALTGVLGARLADPADPRPPAGARALPLTPGQARWTGFGAAGILAVSFTSVRLSRIAHPEHLQLVFMLACALCALAFDRSRRLAPLAAAGALAGLAGATKYLGVMVGLVPLLSVLCWRSPPRAKSVCGNAVLSPGRWAAFLRIRRKAAGQTGTGGSSGPAFLCIRGNVATGQLAVLAGTALAGFLAGTLGTVRNGGAFLRGFGWQVGHQAGGHLGYEAAGPGWLFHLGTSMPGSWGWPVTVLAVAGCVAVLVRGSRAQRLVAVLALVLFALIGASQVRFPHYVLIVYPEFAALACVAVGRIRPRAARAAVCALVAASLGVVALDDVRLTRSAGAPSTRLAADDAVASIAGPVWSESYSLTSPRERQVSAFGTAPEVLGCRCVAVVSSYQEERYRRRPDRYGPQIAVYDALRARGRVLAVLRPSRPLSYRWDLLPQWGAGRLRLTGPVGPVGPTITLVDLGACVGIPRDGVTESPTPAHQGASPLHTPGVPECPRD
ncbi:MAG: phospholipid carrier-dependent glycosyltransferase [Egibacteraceae bacterium]